MTTQFNRFFRLRFIRNSGDYLELSDNKVTFNTVLTIVQAPNHCNIRIYNLSKQTERAIASGEFGFVHVEAGYEQNYTTIFYGSLKYARAGRVDSADSYLDVLGSDGDIWYNYFYHNTTLNSNYTLEQLMTQAASQAKVDMPRSTEVQRNFIDYQIRNTPSLPPLPDGQAPRGRVLYGPAREQFRKWGQNYGFNWSIQEGQLTLIPSNAYSEGATVAVNSQTGLIGYPTVEIDGIKLKTLLNPSLIVGGRIALNNASIIGFLPSPGYTSGPVQEIATNLQNADGIYKILKAEHMGDTRGQDWYTNVVCVGIDKYVISGSKDLNAVGNMGNHSLPNRVNN